MADKKPSTRSGAPGGDRPMRRRDSQPDARGKKTAGKPFDKPGAERGAPKGGAKSAVKGAVKGAAKGAAKGSGKWAEAGEAAAPRRERVARPARNLPAPVEKTSAFEGERIAKAMARAGVCSRRDAEEWIEAGRIAVNGKVLKSPAVNVTEADKITIDGAPMQARERTRLFLFHKPQGYVTTAHDPEGRATVFSYLDERHPDLPRLVSVGRLDINTEGLLLLTNDGGLARTLELPATGWTRRYRVRVHGDIDQARLDALRGGVTVDDVTYAPIEARLERVQGANAWIAMALTEGKNREVKRVMEHLGLSVTRLIRISYGPFQLGDLAEGAVEEVKLKVLRDQLGKSLAEFAGVDFASPLREATPAEEEAKREHADNRARKHVSVLRKQRDEQTEKGPRARIERSATADRKGRAVAVERVTLTRRKAPAAASEEPASRNARRFDALRGEPRRSEGRTERPRGEERRFERSEGPRPEGARGPRRPREDEAAPARRGRSGAESFARPEGGEKRRTSRFTPDSAERAPRAGGRGGMRARPEGGEARFERRAPRRDDDARRAGGAGSYEERAPRRAGGRDGAENRAERPPRRTGPEGARPGRGRDVESRAERPRGPRSEGAGESRRTFERPRGERGAGPAREDRGPRGGARGGAPRGGAEGRSQGEWTPKGPPRGRTGGASGSGPGRGPGRSPGAGKGFGKGPGAGPARGPRNGPGKGPGKGPSMGPGKGPRKPRGE